MWTYWIHDARSGDPLLQVFPRSGQATTRITGTGEGSHVFDLLDAKTKLDRVVLRDLFRENDRVITVRWGDYVAYAGLILQPRYSRSDGLLTVRSREIRSIWRERLTFPMNDYALGDLLVAGKDIPGWVRAILERAMQWSDEWKLPIDLPPDGSGPWGGDWKRYQLLSIENLLAMVEKQGYEVMFRPYLASGNKLRWDVPIGRPILYGATDLPVTTRKSQVSNLVVTSDGTRQLSGVFFAGNGTEEDMVKAYAGSGGTGGGPRMIIRDASRSSKDQRDQEALTREAAEELARFRAPTVQWSFDVDCTEGVQPVDLQPGRYIRMDIRKDPWVNDDVHEKRSIAITVDETLTVSPEVQNAG